jgi:FSR family fosmidomycin resistance protein-like MFS transporter
MVLVVTLRSFIYFGLLLFVAQYYAEEFGASLALGNTALTVMLFAGAGGTLLAGPLADRLGRRTVLAGSMLVLGPLILLFTLSGPVMGIVLLAAIGATTIGTFGTTVVMGQEYLPGRIGLAAGITIGFSIGLGGLGAPVLGALAESRSLTEAILLLAALPVVGLLLTLSLPRSGRPGKPGAV